MFAFLSKLIDWSIFQGVALAMPPGHAQNPRLEQALQFLNRPDFIATESHPARLEFETRKSGVRFRFSQPATKPLCRKQCRLRSALPLHWRMAAATGGWRFFGPCWTVAQL
jgi:hypothetical protein